MNTPINIEVYKLSAFMLDKGPKQTSKDAMDAEVPKKLMQFWENTQQIVDYLNKNQSKIQHMTEDDNDSGEPKTPEDIELMSKYNETKEYRRNTVNCKSGNVIFLEIAKIFSFKN